jgi:hypothetical protein
MKETTLKLRIEPELKKVFLSKATAEYGSGTRCLRKFIEAYTKDTFYISDKAAGLLVVAVQGLHAYTNNVNQIAKKFHTMEELDPRFTSEFVEQIHDEIVVVIKAFKSVVEIDTDRINSLIESYQEDHRA